MSSFISSGGGGGAQGPQGAQGAQGATGAAAVIFDAYANRPAANTVTEGTHFIASDGGVEFISLSNVWRSKIGGTVGYEVPLVASWSYLYGVTPDDGTAEDKQGSTWLRVPYNTGIHAFGLMNAIGGNIQLTVHVRSMVQSLGNLVSSAQSVSAGIIISESSSGEAYTFGVGLFGNNNDTSDAVAPCMNISHWSSPNAGGFFAPGGNSQVCWFGPDVAEWLRYTRTGTSQTWEYSMNGRDWISYNTYTDGDLGITPDRLGIYLANQSSAGTPGDALFDSVKFT